MVLLRFLIASVRSFKVTEVVRRDLVIKNFNFNKWKPITKKLYEKRMWN
jgi:hypothetical protein